ncbi:sodium-dependent phosphate transport protein 2B-like isoform X8 [Monodelphis domestica]|uniref:sodium-dependent phosphate transport protein 2B-like isoform X8 n=1 Tax=Monodelphis domestica TaxID=13616 RepID=UPI0024E24499|nr:sodium-dependent phosphate transport protein 2B-like isoform X8 [Monodelphis domestica]
MSLLCMSARKGVSPGLMPTSFANNIFCSEDARCTYQMFTCLSMACCKQLQCLPADCRKSGQRISLWWANTFQPDSLRNAGFAGNCCRAEFQHIRIRPRQPGVIFIFDSRDSNSRNDGSQCWDCNHQYFGGPHVCWRQGRIWKLNKKVFTELAAGNQEAKNKSLIKIWCKTFENVTFSNVTVPSPENCTSPTLCWTEGNITWTLKNRTYQQNIAKCKHLFVNTSLSDSVIGFILLPLSLFILCGCLILFIRVLNSELRGPVAAVIKKYINTDFPFPFTWLAGYLVILVGALLTFLVQSSSVFTSTITPLVGTEVISLERVYCLTLGSNIGTTTTAILAALASPPRTFKQSLQIALCHFFFNITGILLWYPIPFIRLPLLFARRLGNITTTYRWFAIVYLIFSFFLGPLLVFCFSIASRTVLIYVGLPLYFLPFVVVYLHIFNVLKLFPLWMRDLKPWDDLITSIMVGCRQCGENLSHQWKKLQGPTLKPDPGPDQNHRPRAIEDSLFYVKKSDDTVSKNTINKWAVLNDSSAD